MAGIGFVLQKLADRDNLSGIVGAYLHSAFASAGPWLCTVLALAFIATFFNDYFANENLLLFRTVIIYNLAMSLVLSAPVYMVATRYLADRIHIKDVSNTPSVMLGCMVLSYAIQLPVGLWFYFGFANLDTSLAICGMINLFLITTVWLLGVFLTALKDYNAVTWAFFWGMTVGVLCAWLFKENHGAIGMLNGFSIGLGVIVFWLASRVFAEYPYRLHKPFAMMPWFRKYWELAVAGVVYNAAIWIDKLVMWYNAPESLEVLNTNLWMYPDYDSAMFLAYLTIVPAMALFIFSVETDFFERYQRYYEDILDHMPLKKIRQNQRRLIDSILEGSRNFIIVQGIICFLAIALAVKIFEVFNISFLQIGIFRIATLGAFFHVLLLFQLIILSYFDDRRTAMWLQIFYFVTNLGLTIFFLNSDFGFSYYGYGYFLSSMLTFILTSLILFSHARKLTFHSFITSNNALRGRPAIEHD